MDSGLEPIDRIGPSVAIATVQKPRFFSETSLQLVLRDRFFCNLFLRNIEDISSISYTHVLDQFLIVWKLLKSQYGFSTVVQGHFEKFLTETPYIYMNELGSICGPRMGLPIAPTNFFDFRLKPVTEWKTCIFQWISLFSKMANAAANFVFNFETFYSKFGVKFLWWDVYKTSFFDFWFFVYFFFIIFFLEATRFSVLQINFFTEFLVFHVFQWNFAWWL